MDKPTKTPLKGGTVGLPNRVTRKDDDAIKGSQLFKLLFELFVFSGLRTLFLQR